MGEHTADAQARAFTDAAPGDLVTDADLAAMYASGALNDTTAGPVIGVAEHEDVAWDAGREEPKDVGEARDALLARVDDPTAPDTDPTAYDAL